MELGETGHDELFLAQCSCCHSAGPHRFTCPRLCGCAGRHRVSLSAQAFYPSRRVLALSLEVQCSDRQGNCRHRLDSTFTTTHHPLTTRPRTPRNHYVDGLREATTTTTTTLQQRQRRPGRQAAESTFRLITTPPQQKFPNQELAVPRPRNRFPNLPVLCDYTTLPPRSSLEPSRPSIVPPFDNDLKIPFSPGVPTQSCFHWELECKR